MQYTYEELAGALRKAHAAGNVQHATALTKAIQQLQANENNVPTQPVQGDTSLGTAFKHGDLMAQANTMDYVAEANVEAQKGWYGAISDPGRKYIGNPIREYFGYEPLKVGEEGVKVQEENLKNTKIQTDKMRDKAKALNYQSLTSDHLSLNPVTWAQYGAQKVAESGPQMLASIASGGAMTMPLLAGEVNQNMKEIEGLDQNTRIKLATAGGTIAAAIENLGLGLLIKGIPKEVLGKMGANGIVDMAAKVYGAKVAGKVATAMATEGITEGAQEYTFLRTEDYAGAGHDAATYGERLKEATIGGAFAGGTIRSGAEVAIPVAKKVAENMPDTDSLKMIHGGDQDALAEVASDAEALFNEYPDRKISSLDDSKETLDDLHSQYQIQWSKIKEGINSKVKKSEEFRIAEKRAKNKVKNEASKDDIAYLESVSPELGKLARKMNVITRFNRAGIRGGVGQYTQALSPLSILRGMSGRSSGGQSQYSQGLNRSLLGVVVGAGTSGASLVAPIGAEIIDATTGLKNRLKNAIKRYKNRPGITAPSQPTDTDPNNPEGYTGKQLDEIEKTIKTKAEYKHIKVLMDEIEQLRKKQQETEAKIQGQQGNIDDFIDNDNIQAKIDELQKQIKKVADDKGITGTTPTGDVIRNEYAYKSAIELAEKQRDIAIDGAPEVEIKSLITRIADARSREEKRAIYEEGIEKFPEHKQYFEDNIKQLTEFGPEVRKETSVQEKVLQTGDPDIVQEKSNIKERVEKNFNFGPDVQESRFDSLGRRTFMKGLAAAAASPLLSFIPKAPAATEILSSVVKLPGTGPTKMIVGTFFEGTDNYRKLQDIQENYTGGGTATPVSGLIEIDVGKEINGILNEVAKQGIDTDIDSLGTNVVMVGKESDLKEWVEASNQEWQEAAGQNQFTEIADIPEKYKDLITDDIPDLLSGEYELLWERSRGSVQEVTIPYELLGQTSETIDSLIEGIKNQPHEWMEDDSGRKTLANFSSYYNVWEDIKVNKNAKTLTIKTNNLRSLYNKLIEFSNTTADQNKVLLHLMRSEAGLYLHADDQPDPESFEDYEGRAYDMHINLRKADDLKLNKFLQFTARNNLTSLALEEIGKLRNAAVNNYFLKDAIKQANRDKPKDKLITPDGESNLEETIYKSIKVARKHLKYAKNEGDQAQIDRLTYFIETGNLPEGYSIKRAKVDITANVQKLLDLVDKVETAGKLQIEYLEDVVDKTEKLAKKQQELLNKPKKIESLHKNVWEMPLSDSQIKGLINEALNEGFDVKLNASDNAYYRRQQAITLKSDATKTQVLHEIFHAVENKLSPQEMSTILNSPIAKEIATEVNELYPELDGAAKTMEILAETSARLQSVRGNTGKLAYILSRIKDLIEAFKNLLEGNGFRSVNSVLDEIYTGKAHQRAVNENYDMLYVPDVQLAKSDKPGGPMVAKRVKVLRQMEEMSKDAELKAKDINNKYEETINKIAKNLNIEGITPEVLSRTLSGITPSTELGHIAVNYLKAVGAMDENGVIPGAETNEDAAELAMQWEKPFIALIKALQKSKAIGDFGLAFRTSAGGRLYPVHMLEPAIPALLDKANLNNIRKLKNRVTTTPLTTTEINGHDLGSYENTKEFIRREQQQPLVINDQIYKMISRMANTPQIHRGLDLVFKKDGTTDSAYTLAAGEAIKQYEDHQTEEGGMSPVYMKRKAQDRLRIDALNGSASYQGKAGKAIWEFANWEDLGTNGFEQFAHSLRDHFGISNELPYNERVAWLFGTVGQYMKLAGRPKSEYLTQQELDMPLIDWIINGTGMNGGHVYAHNRGGVPKLFLDKGDIGGKKIILYQKNHAIFDVAEHGFEMQRAAIELGRMRAFLEKNMKGANKIPSSELFMMEEALALLSQFKSSYPTWFDATSSAYQLHAVLTGDTGLAKVTNILNMDRDGPAGDLYRPGAEYLERTLNLPQVKTRKITKKFISNRRSYGQVKLTARKAGQDQISKELPEYADQGPDTPQNIKDSLSNIQRDLETQFDTEFPGAAIAEGVARSIAKHLFDIQGREFFAVRVPLPDGDVAVYDGKVPDSAKRRITWQLDGKNDKRVGVPVYKDRIAVTGFAAFLNHALDAYVQRELAKRLRAQGVSGFMHTHDAFAVHPKNAALMRELYHQIVLEVANTPIYEEILKANGLDANDMTVKYNITSQEGGTTEEVGMLEILQNIRNNKAATFGKNQSTNYYALS